MRTSFAILFLSLTYTISGCGRASGDGASGTPDAKVLDATTNYAQAIRTSALSIRDALREQDGGLESAKGGTESLLEALEGYESNADAAVHKSTYDELAKLAKELKGMFELSAPLQQIQQKINELGAAAEKLPGAGTDPAASGPQNNT